MCKIFSVVGCDNNELAVKLFMAAYPIIIKHDNHALGYACANDDESIYGERFVLDKNGDVQEKDAKTYNSFGKDNGTPLKTFMIHARFATGAKTIENTHPFVNNKNYLIHNGVVKDENLTLKTSTCDSEAILNTFCDLNIGYFPDRFKYLTQVIDGWYAINMFTKIKEKYYFDVFKERRSNLTVSKIKGVRGLIYCTLKSHAEEIFKAVGITEYEIEDVKDYKLIRHDVLTGEILETYDAKKRSGDYEYDRGWNSRGYDSDIDDYPVMGSYYNHKKTKQTELKLIDTKKLSKKQRKALKRAQAEKEEKELDRRDDIDYIYCPRCKSNDTLGGYCFTCGNSEWNDGVIDDCSMANNYYSRHNIYE